MRAIATALALAALVPGLVRTPSASAENSPLVDRGFAAAVDNQISTREPIDLTAYAAGDGRTPDGAAVNRAIADAASSGRPLLAPAGRTFLIDQVLLLRSGVTVYGGGVFRAAKALGDRPVMLNADFNEGNERIALVGIEIDADRDVRGNPGGTAHGIWLHGGDATPVRQVLIRDVKVRDAPMLGVPLQNVQDVLIERLQSSGHGRDGLTFYWNSRRIEVLSPEIRDCGDDLIGLNAEDGKSNGHRLEDVLIDSPVLAGQYDQGSAIAVHGARRVTVRNARVEGSFHAALSVGNWNRTAAEDVTVDGLTAIDPGRAHSGGAGHGIEMYAGAGNRSLAGSAGVRRVRITGLDVRRPRAQGVALFGAPGAEIADVFIRGSIRGGDLYASSRGVTSSTGHVNGLTLELDVRDMPAEGIFLHGASEAVRDVVIRNSHVAGNGRSRAAAGVDLERVESLTVEDTVSTGQAWGIRAVGIAGASAMRRVDVRGNTAGGLLLRDAALLLEGQQGNVDGRASAPQAATAAPVRLRVGRRAVRRGRVTFRARCAGGCGAQASAKLLLGRRTVGFRRADVRLESAWTRVTLRVAHGSRAALRRALGSRTSAVELRVRVTAAGDAQGLRRKVRLR